MNEFIEAVHKLKSRLDRDIRETERWLAECYPRTADAEAQAFRDLERLRRSLDRVERWLEAGS